MLQACKTKQLLICLVVLVLTTRQHNIGSLTWNMQYFLSMTYTFIKNERKKYTLNYTVLIHKYGNEHSISLIWKIKIFFSVSHSALLLKFEANAYLITLQWKFLFPLSDYPQMIGRSLMSHRACCHTCYTIQLMHYSHFKTQSLQHLKPIKC